MQISRNSFTLLAGAAASALILSACGGGSSTPAAQAALTVAAVSTVLDPSGTTTLSSSGGSGTGATTYNATGACTVSGTTVTAASTGGACAVTATKAADASYLAITSTALTVTVRAPQAALSVAAASTSLSAGGTTNLSTTGGSGAGAVTYQVTGGGCTVSAAVLTAPASDATCSVTATKAADGSSFAQATSTNTLTVTVTVPSTTFLTFDETTAPTLTPFSGANTMAATIETDPAGGTNKVAKLVKSAGSDTWAGATVSKCAYPTNSLPVIPLSATNKKMSMKVYSSVANKVIRLKLEDASDVTHTVETEATVTAANTWQTLTFDFGSAATGTAAWNAAFTYNKASAFPDFGATAASTMYIDDLKFVGVANVAQTCLTAPVSSVPTTAPAVPTAAIANVKSLYGDGYTTVTGTDTPNWGQPTVVSAQTYASNNVLKLATFSYQGVVTAAPLDVSSHTSLHIDFWSETATTIEVKLVSLSPTLETSVFVTVAAGTWTSKDIPMSSFTAPDKSKFQQLILAAAVNGGTLYVDNIYFWK